MGYGPFGKPTTVSIKQYERLKNEFNELLTEHKDLIKELDKYKKTYSSIDEDFYQLIEEAKDNLNKFIKV